MIFTGITDVSNDINTVIISIILFIHWLYKNVFNAEEEEDNPYLVDFQQKYIDKALRHHETDTVKNVEDTEKSDNVEDDEWYEYMYNIVKNSCNQ